jgi:D-glycero-alpha-D-manno-heptose 1-phosphate guanylyltransferase
MAPVSGRPFLAHLLDYAAGQGVSRAVLSTGYLGATISGYFGARYGGVDLVYTQEEQPLGTGGALVRAFERVEGDTALVLNGDTLFAIGYGALHALHRAMGAGVTMALRPAPDCSRYGCVVVRDGRVRQYRAAGEAAPGLIGGGVYAIAREVLRRYPLPVKFSLEKDLLEPHVAELEPAAFVSDAPFLDIGVPEAYGEAAGFLRRLRGA